MMKTKLQAHCRWMIRRDMNVVLGIENAEFPIPWTEEDFVRCLRQRCCIGMVAEVDGDVLGYMLYELHHTRILLLNFAVSWKFARRGVGTTMLEKLKCKTSIQRRERIEVTVRETNLPALLFFKANGFVATDLLKGHYEDSDDDAVVMVYTTNREGVTTDDEVNGRCDGR